MITIGLIAVVVTIVAWYVQTHTDRRKYDESPGVGVPWECDLCGGRFQGRQAALSHAEAEHPNAGGGRSPVRVASGITPAG